MTETNDPASKARQLEALVEHWFFETFHDSPVARFTEVWNHVHDAKQDLQRRLAAFLAEELTKD